MNNQNNEYTYSYTQGDNADTNTSDTNVNSDNTSSGYHTGMGYNAGTNYDAGRSSEYAYSYKKEPAPKPKKKRKAPRWLKVAGLGIIFGIVASIAFQASNQIAKKALGIDNEIGGGESKVESTALTNATGSTITSDVSEMVKNTMPSVVSITNLSVQQVQNFFGGIQEYESESAGSGIIIAQNEEELLIVTNNHVVEGNDSLTVSFIDEESVEAHVKGTDATRDLAVIAVSVDAIKDSTINAIAVAQMGDSNKLQVGEPAIAIGNALGYGQSVTTGIVSALNRRLEGFDSNLIQTDAAINPGNSGGALMNANGEVIGINTIKVATDTVEGMGYAIPISDASEIIKELMNQKTKTKVPEKEQGALGVQGTDVTSDAAQMYGMPVGFYIAEVLKGSAAEKAGITKGCIITKIGGTTVDSGTAVQNELQYYRAGEEVDVTIQVQTDSGEYEEKVVTVKLDKKS